LSNNKSKSNKLGRVLASPTILANTGRLTARKSKRQGARAQAACPGKRVIKQDRETVALL